MTDTAPIPEDEDELPPLTPEQQGTFDRMLDWNPTIRDPEGNIIREPEPPERGPQDGEEPEDDKA